MSSHKELLSGLESLLLQSQKNEAETDKLQKEVREKLSEKQCLEEELQKIQFQFADEASRLQLQLGRQEDHMSNLDVKVKTFFHGLELVSKQSVQKHETAVEKYLQQGSADEKYNTVREGFEKQSSDIVDKIKALEKDITQINSQRDATLSANEGKKQPALENAIEHSKQLQEELNRLTTEVDEMKECFTRSQQNLQELKTEHGMKEKQLQLAKARKDRADAEKKQAEQTELQISTQLVKTRDMLIAQFEPLSRLLSLPLPEAGPTLNECMTFAESVQAAQQAVDNAKKKQNDLESACAAQSEAKRGKARALEAELRQKIANLAQLESLRAKKEHTSQELAEAERDNRLEKLESGRSYATEETLRIKEQVLPQLQGQKQATDEQVLRVKEKCNSLRSKTLALKSRIMSAASEHSSKIESNRQEFFWMAEDMESKLAKKEQLTKAVKEAAKLLEQAKCRENVLESTLTAANQHYRTLVLVAKEEEKMVKQHQVLQADMKQLEEEKERVLQKVQDKSKRLEEKEKLLRLEREKEVSYNANMVFDHPQFKTLEYQTLQLIQERKNKQQADMALKFQKQNEEFSTKLASMDATLNRLQAKLGAKAKEP